MKRPSYRSLLTNDRHMLNALDYSKICPGCDKVFFPCNSSQKYCTAACKHKQEPTWKVNIPCANCGKIFIPKTSVHKYCCTKCQPSSVSHHTMQPQYVPVPSGTQGAIGELAVGNELMRRGFQVFRCLSSHAFCDLVAVNETETMLIEVRTALINKNGSRSFPRKLHQLGQRKPTHYGLYYPMSGFVELFRLVRLARTIWLLWLYDLTFWWLWCVLGGF